MPCYHRFALSSSVYSTCENQSTFYYIDSFTWRKYRLLELSAFEHYELWILFNQKLRDRNRAFKKTCWWIDRKIRPLLAAGWTGGIQLRDDEERNKRTHSKSKYGWNKWAKNLHKCIAVKLTDATYIEDNSILLSTRHSLGTKCKIQIQIIAKTKYRKFLVEKVVRVDFGPNLCNLITRYTYLRTLDVYMGRSIRLNREHSTLTKKEE